MSDFKQQYKNPRTGFGDTSHNRNLRAYKQDKSRREIRSRAFDRNRELQNVSASTSPQPENVPTIKDERTKKLLKWKEERNRKKKLEAAKKKPAFKVGVVHHSLYSPRVRSDKPAASTKSSQQAKAQNNVPKRITKVTQKRLEARAAAAAAAAMKQSSTLQNTTSTLTLTKHQVNIKKPVSSKKLKSFAPDGYEFRPPSGVKEIPLFGFVTIEETPQEKGDFFIKEKSTTNNTLDINKQKETLLQELSISNFDISAIGSEFRTSSPISPLNKRRSSQRSNKSVCHSNNVTYVHNETKIQDNTFTLEENKCLPVSTDMKTPSSQKTTSTDTSSAKEKDLIVFSPYLTLSRGKKNARREQQQRLGIGRLSSNEIPTKDTVMKNLNITVEEEERTAQYFKFLLNKETDRLKELCENWLQIQLEKDVPDDAKYEINQAVGQTNLLINKKFKRFGGLVQDCETGKGEMLVTCRDLQGFWDMTHMEVKDCDSRFEKLEQRRSRGWQEEECTVAKIIAKKRVPSKKQIVSSKPSSLRSLILAARKKKMETGTLNKEDMLLQDKNIKEKYVTPLNNRKSINSKENIDIRRSMRSKSFDVNERSKSTPARRSSSRASLQKAPFSDKSKKMKSPYAAMKISQLCKTPDVQLDDTITYVNSDQTPGKSILKKSEELINKEARIKSAHKVNFDDQVFSADFSLDKEKQIKLSLRTSLNRIDSFDFVEVTPEERINAEKKLNFETVDSEEEATNVENVQTEIKKKQNKSAKNVADSDSDTCDVTIVPRQSSRNSIHHKTILNSKIINVSSSTQLSNNNEISVSSETISNQADMEQDNEGIKVLRNRTITANNTPKISRRSKVMTPKRISVSKKENKSPIKCIENIDNRRKSSRKSVAFNVDDCVACTEVKPVLPMTPHTKKRRSKTPSRQNRNEHLSDEDFTARTPERPPSRVTRSSHKN